MIFHDSFRAKMVGPLSHGQGMPSSFVMGFGQGGETVAPVDAERDGRTSIVYVIVLLSLQRYSFKATT